ncbi:MAG: dynamin family protein [Eubacteriales bacterium]|nr:dynamin family protein [Eubacteriales bacterium]
MDTENTTYESYHGMVANINTALANMADLCGRLELTEAQEKLENSKNTLTQNKFSVGIMGEFKRGKSTVINALLGQEIMPADILPCSATMNRVTYDTNPRAEVIMHDGTVKNVNIDGIADYVTKTNEDNANRASMVDQAVVYYPCIFCQNGVDIVDTPGLNDDERMDKISEEIIPKLDAVIMVVVPGAPFSVSEANFVRNKLMASDVGRLIFVVNKIDTIRKPKDRERCVQGIKEKVQKAVLDKTKEVYGEDSPEYEETKSKVGNIRIYPISAANALDGRLEHDEDLVEESGIKAFEDGLTYLLTAERGVLQLIKPIQEITAAYTNVKSAAQALKESQKLSAAEFEKRQKEAMEKIEKLRAEKRAELQSITVKKNETLAAIKTQIPGFYDELEKRLITVAENYKVNKASLQTREGQEEMLSALSSQVSQAMNQRISNYCEKLLGEAKRALEGQMEDSSKFLGVMNVETENIRFSFTNKKKDDDGFGVALSIAGAVGEIATTFMGLGGISGAIEGWKAGGVPGAVAGFATGFAAIFGTAVFCSSIGLVGLPFLAISTVASGVSGRIIGEKIGEVFGGGKGNKEYKAIMQMVREHIYSSIESMRKGNMLENEIGNRVSQSFAQLRQMVDAEADQMLNDTQQTLDKMKENLTKNKLEREQIERRCNDIIDRANKIMEDIQPTIERIKASRQAS